MKVSETGTLDIVDARPGGVSAADNEDEQGSGEGSDADAGSDTDTDASDEGGEE